MPMSISTPIACSENPAWVLSAAEAASVPPVASTSSIEQEPARRLLHLEHARAVFEVVRDVDDGRRQLALLANRHEALAAPIGQRRGEDEPARFDPGNGVDLAPFPLA